jgi:hypothetical protein
MKSSVFVSKIVSFDALGFQCPPTDNNTGDVHRRASCHLSMLRGPFDLLFSVQLCHLSLFSKKIKIKAKRKIAIIY